MKGKLVDIAVMNENKDTLAVEVALTPKNEMRNITADLAVGFDKVIIACKNPRVKTEIDNSISEYLDDDSKSKIETIFLYEFARKHPYRKK
jgi:hypothetical protein